MDKIIKARLPEGFRIEVQESENFLPHNVLVLINNEKQRLYVKILPKEDLIKGHIFEILKPSELKQTLNIEESYNEDLYVKKGFVVEESTPEEKRAEFLAKGLKKFNEEEGEGRPVNIIIQKKGEEEGERPLTVEEKRYVAKEAFKSAIREAREEEALEKAEKEGLGVRTDPVGHGGAGQIPLSDAQTGGGKEKGYDSHEAMVFDLTIKKISGSPQEKARAKAVLDKLWQKQREAMQSGDLPHKIYEDDLRGGKSIIKRIMDAENEIVKRRMRERK